MSDFKELPPLHDAAPPLAPYGRTINADRYIGKYGPRDEDEEGEDQFPLLGYWQLLVRHRGLLVLACAAGAVLGFLASLPRTPIYEARTSLEIQSLNDGFLGMRDLNPTAQGSNWYGTDVSTQIEILQSRSLIAKVRDRLAQGGREDVAGSEGRLATWRRALGFEDVDPEERWMQAVEVAADSLKATPSRDSRIVWISAESTDPKMAANFVNELAGQFTTDSIEARWEATQYTEEWLDRQLEELRNKLEDAEDRLQATANATGLVFTSETSNVAQQQLQQLQTALAVARAERIARQSRFELARSSPTEALPDILGSGPLSAYDAKLNTLRQELANLLVTYTDSFPQVKRIRAEIEEIEKARERESNNIITGIESQYQESMRRENLLQADYDNQSRLVSEQARTSIQYNILKREVDTTRQLYDNLLQKGKEARLAAAMKASPVRVVDAAIPDDIPIRPNHLKNSVLGLLVGLLLGGAFIIGREKVDRTLRNPGDAELYVSSPELGFVPAMDFNDKERKIRIRLGAGEAKSAEASSELALEKRRSHALVRRVRHGSGPDAPETITWTDQQSWAGECFQATLTSILFSGSNGSAPRQLVVTSSAPGEGKSTVTSNLGIAIAEINQTVLLIDADMRRPRQHKIFDVANDQGLSDLLRHPEELDAETVKLCAKATSVPGLVVIPSGPGAGSVSNLLHSMRTRELLKIVRESFDWVLIDTPPMSQLSDARLLARLTDGVVFVVKAGSTSRDSAVLCEERLTKDGSRVIGFVLNDWNPKSSPSSYGKYHDYSNYKNYYTRNESDEA